MVKNEKRQEKKQVTADFYVVTVISNLLHRHMYV